MVTISISDKVMRTGGVVVLPRKEYERLSERAVPEYYLSGKAAQELDALVEEGARDYYTGRTVRASSVKNALREYAKKDRKR